MRGNGTTKFRERPVGKYGTLAFRMRDTTTGVPNKLNEIWNL